ncbi:hypothetical protein [Bradyrhizobium sp. 1(2017)]|uniref:hypothetical protein n=1 Tax=Bradyrhizobium sp. 1(2017) TaxID=1404888 RepID=UPI00140F389D|nr:hypothetical protein [Bradyrhizobium sp. 1(2017)]QIO31361.1 hypothetical protein HAP40_05755 [Bradyrhizobium sp. 1(2017)]
MCFYLLLERYNELIERRLTQASELAEAIAVSRELLARSTALLQQPPLKPRLLDAHDPKSDELP